VDNSDGTYFRPYNVSDFPSLMIFDCSENFKAAEDDW
jgi:hypothetical protein